MHFAPFGKARSKAVPTARRLRRSAPEWRAAVLFDWPLVAGTVLCLADWVSVEDLGFLGGIGTDPNSMVPIVMLSGAGYLAITRAPSTAAGALTTRAPFPARS